MLKSYPFLCHLSSSFSLEALVIQLRCELSIIKFWAMIKIPRSTKQHPVLMYQGHPDATMEPRSQQARQGQQRGDARDLGRRAPREGAGGEVEMDGTCVVERRRRDLGI